MTTLQNSAPAPKQPPIHTFPTLPKRLHSLTPLRFVAAIAVVLVHVGFQFANAPALTIAAGYGYAGVSFFYLLSGFVLTWSATGQQSAPRFWWLRFSRIWPLQFGLMLVAFTVLAEQERIPGPFGKATEVMLLQAWVPHRNVYFGGNGVSWSLSCEMFFYLVFPLVIGIVGTLRARGVAIATCTTLAVMAATPIAVSGHVADRTFSWLFFIFPPYRFGEFLIGMLLARAVVLGLRIRRPRLAWVGALGGLTLLVLAATRVTVHTGSLLPRPMVDLLSLPFFALLLLGSTSIELGPGRTVLNRSLPVRLGEWSFALYLVHKPMFLLTRQWGWWGNSGGLDGLMWLLAFLASATLVAAAVHHAIEKPIERNLRKLPVGRRRDLAC